MSTMAITKRGREKLYQCPYCKEAGIDFRTYSILNLNMHIGTQHGGERTIKKEDKDNYKIKSKLKEFVRKAPAKVISHDDPQPKAAPTPDQKQDEDDEEEDDIYG